MEEEELSTLFSYLNPELISLIAQNTIFKEFEKGVEILREGQYVKVIPVVLRGLVKVISQYEEKDLLLYYIRPNESCIMSFTAGINQKTSKIFAVTEEKTAVLLIPADKVAIWIKQFPDFNSLFFQQFDLRYGELLTTINHVLFDKIDVRLYNYLLEKVRLTNKNPIKILHREIANDLGTAREVISRVMKKLENEGKVKQYIHSIEIL